MRTDLRPFEPVSDEMVLDAVARAERHAKAEAVAWHHIVQRLGFVHNGWTTRNLRPQVHALVDAGSLKRSRRGSLDLWGLTSEGRERLAQAQRMALRKELVALGRAIRRVRQARQLDREAHPACQHVERRAMLATLTFAGLRISELCALRWRDVDLAAGWLHVGEAKTDAGRRRVKLRGALRDELLAVRARHSQAPTEAFVFPTLRGGRQSPDNFRSRVLKVAVQRANKNLAKRDLAPLPERITPHSLRRTFCSLLYALGEDPGVVMDEMGHTNPGLALRVYRQAMRRGEDEKTQLRALIEGAEVADIGRRAPETPSETTERKAA
jgi:integrase